MSNIEYITGGVLGLILGVAIGGCIVNFTGIKSNSIVKPEITIECLNNKCDTTYVYKNK